MMLCRMPEICLCGIRYSIFFSVWIVKCSVNISGLKNFNQWNLAFRMVKFQGHWLCLGLIS
jgi:hypothetical protein